MKETECCDGRKWGGGIRLLGCNDLSPVVTLELGGLNGERSQQAETQKKEDQAGRALFRKESNIVLRNRSLGLKSCIQQFLPCLCALASSFIQWTY